MSGSRSREGLGRIPAPRRLRVVGADSEQFVELALADGAKHSSVLRRGSWVKAQR